MPKEYSQIVWDAALQAECRRIVGWAVQEDLGRQFDWTTAALVPPEAIGQARVVARQAGVVAGLPAGRLVLDEIDPRIEWISPVAEGSAVAVGGPIVTIRGPARSLLAAERLLLNLLGHLSGIATLTRRFVDAVAGTKARIYDTRKTTPGWRRLEKYAVRQGGGWNHRTGLFDAVLIKDNHLAAIAPDGVVRPSTPADAINRVRQFLSGPDVSLSGLPVEVEVDSLEQLAAVLPVRPDIVLLDNMTLADLSKAVALRNSLGPAIELEASGGVRLDTVADIARTGVERISVGALTHSAVSLDVGLDWF